MRVVFMGTPAFALPPLEMLLKNKSVEVVAVYTQPDRANRRGNKITFSPVKQLAVEQGVPVYQPATLRDSDAQDELRSLRPDVLIVVAYGQILPAEVLEIPTYGALNIHASLLPKYRGAAPIQRAILAGEKETGVSLMRLDEGMDTGDVLCQATLKIEESMDSDALTIALSELGAEVLQESLENLPERLTQAQPQDHTQATYADKIDKKEGQVNWQQRAEDVKNLVRALHANPGTYTYFRNKRLKLHRLGEIADTTSGNPGEVVSLADGRLWLRCSDKAIEICELQPENKGRMNARDFINGYQLKLGEKFD